MSTTTSDFPAAARRHFAGAKLLHASQHLPDGDHLAGVAAECALKAILIGHLGGHFDSRGKPVHSNNQRRLGHLPALWDELALIVQGRQAGTLSSLLSGPNKFSQWDVAERYSNGTHISETRARGHLNSAEEVLRIFQQAEIDGVL